MKLKTFLTPIALASALFAICFGSALFAAETPGAAPAQKKSDAKPNVIRIMAALNEPLTDETGVVWGPSEGFEDGDSMDRPGTKIENTKIPSVYCSERFGMSKFSKKLPNGNYTVKLHFAVTYEGISGAGQVVFTFDVEGKETADFDLWEKAGGGQRAHVETIPVEISDEKLDITFTSQASESTTISAIEIIPAK